MHFLKPYKDPFDQLEFPKSLSPSDDYKPNEDELDKDDGEVSMDSYDRDADVTPPANSQKCARSDSTDADNDNKYERARKIAKSKGRTKASDYADDVQEVIDSTIAHYKVDLLCLDPYPDHTHELAWSKTHWHVANKVCNLKIAHNGKLIKMVSLLVTLFRLCLYCTQITCCGSHLHGEIKMKLKLLVASMYGFKVPTNDTIHACNCELVKELKNGYTFLYKVCHVVLYLFFCCMYLIQFIDMHCWQST